VFYVIAQLLSSQQGASPPPWQVLELGLDPADLKRRIERRTNQLYQEGLVAETGQLISRYGADLPLLNTIGYAEARGLLAGDLDETTAMALTCQRTRQFAKRQRTWFRRQHQPLWLRGTNTEEQLQEVLQEVDRALG
jgi:tRNA dimethylallyltransferase